ncbi:hypothetical protein Dimus_036960, partial [Dionaea muscipula]
MLAARADLVVGGAAPRRLLVECRRRRCSLAARTDLALRDGLLSLSSPLSGSSMISEEADLPPRGFFPLLIDEQEHKIDSHERIKSPRLISFLLSPYASRFPFDFTPSWVAYRRRFKNYSCVESQLMLHAVGPQLVGFRRSC